MVSIRHAVVLASTAATLVLAIAASAAAQTDRSGLGADPGTTRELTEIEARLATTYKAGDCEGWGALLAPEWSVTHITGAVIARAEAIQSCKALPASIESLASDNLAVRVFGDAAVVTGRTTASAGGQTVVLRFTDVFVRRAGKWLAVASQATRAGQ